MTNSSNEIGIFQRVIERGSFAGAAEDMGLSPSAISKLITRLELRLGVRLINRTTRRLALTPEGEIYLERSRDILRAIEATEAEIALARLSPRGHLRVHSFPTFAVDHLSPALPDFLARYPRITFEFLVTNRFVDLIGDNVDIALQVGHLTDLSLVACKIVGLTQVVCASPMYLAAHGRPVQPSDLAQHACLISEPRSRLHNVVVSGQRRTGPSGCQRPCCRRQRAHVAQAGNRRSGYCPLRRYYRGPRNPRRTPGTAPARFAGTRKLSAMGDTATWSATNP